VLDLPRRQESPDDDEGRQPFPREGLAEDWYLELRGKSRTGEITSERNFKKAAEKFLAEYDVITEGQRNAKYVRTRKAESATT
jgi:hypothetical protein